MTLFEALILGVVEGVTEFLPISSTGHLILVSSLLKIPSTEFLKSFEIAIQLGAILAVVALYWKSLFDIETIKKLIVGFLPTAIIGFLLYGIVKTYLLGNNVIVLIALALGGVALIAFEYFHTPAQHGTDSVPPITYRQAFFVGLFQSIAIIPGVSRSAATIVGGLLLGINRITIVEYSFLLAIPTMGAATVLDLTKNASLFSQDQALALGLGFVTAFVVALASIRFLLAYVRNHSFAAFGVYRIVIAAIFFWYFFL